MPFLLPTERGLTNIFYILLYEKISMYRIKPFASSFILRSLVQTIFLSLFLQNPEWEVCLGNSGQIGKYLRLLMAVIYSKVEETLKRNSDKWADVLTIVLLSYWGNTVEKGKEMKVICEENDVYGGQMIENRHACNWYSWRWEQSN